MTDERLTDEQVREVELGLIKAFEAILNIAVPSRKTRRDIETYTRAVHAICDELIERRARVAEPEAKNARLQVHNVRVKNGAIVGLGELLKGRS